MQQIQEAKKIKSEKIIENGVINEHKIMSIAIIFPFALLRTIKYCGIMFKGDE